MLITIVWGIIIFLGVVFFVLCASNRAAEDGYPANTDLEPRGPWSSYCQELSMRESGDAQSSLNTVLFEELKWRAPVW